MLTVKSAIAGMRLTDMPEIKEFKAEHIDGVYELEKICFSHPWSREDLEVQLSIPTSHFAVALDSGRVVGYMGLQILSGEGYVTNIAVLPEYRRQGIAQSLIESCAQNKMDFITLEVRKSNLPAIKLYEKAGFENMGIRPRFYTGPEEDAVIMTRYF